MIFQLLSNEPLSSHFVPYFLGIHPNFVPSFLFSLLVLTKIFPVHSPTIHWIFSNHIFFMTVMASINYQKTSFTQPQLILLVCLSSNDTVKSSFKWTMWKYTHINYISFTHQPFNHSTWLGKKKLFNPLKVKPFSLKALHGCLCKKNRYMI